jgi:hypothetical protein
MRRYTVIGNQTYHLSPFLVLLNAQYSIRPPKYQIYSTCYWIPFACQRTWAVVRLVSCVLCAFLYVASDLVLRSTTHCAGCAGFLYVNFMHYTVSSNAVEVECRMQYAVHLCIVHDSTTGDRKENTKCSGNLSAELCSIMSPRVPLVLGRWIVGSLVLQRKKVVRLLALGLTTKGAEHGAGDFHLSCYSLLQLRQERLRAEIW